ncbi:hypothetical protein ACHQM5_016112 [Ranunculus cassubicifolius]
MEHYTPFPAVKFISTYNVQPHNPNHKTQIIHLTPWDLNLLPVQYIQKGLLFLKPQNHQAESDDKDVINHLKISFARTLDFFFPFAGRLATQKYKDGSISFYVDCNDSGAKLVHATAPIRVSDLLDPLFIPPIVYELFPIKDAINYDGMQLPLLSIQVTFLIDGIFLGITMNHMLCDGSSFWHFMNSWSEISRGSHNISRNPVFERWFINASDCPIRFPSSNEDQFIERYTPPPVKERMFHFTQQAIAKLKAKANSEMDTTQISSLQAVLAHMWVAVTKAKNLNHSEQVMYRLLTGTRSRVNPPLSNEYFGNSVQVVTATSTAGELVQRGLGWAAWLMNRAIATHTDTSVRHSLEAWMKKPVLMSRARIASNDLITGSSPRFNMYGNDFGWGVPIAVRSGCGNKSDGKITVYPGAVRGSMEIEACLSQKTLTAMSDDLDFMGVFS